MHGPPNNIRWGSWAAAGCVCVAAWPTAPRPVTYSWSDIRWAKKRIDIVEHRRDHRIGARLLWLLVLCSTSRCGPLVAVFPLPLLSPYIRAHSHTTFSFLSVSPPLPYAYFYFVMCIRQSSEYGVHVLFQLDACHTIQNGVEKKKNTNVLSRS